MTTTTETTRPAVELRKAALTLRELAAKATRGPWCCYPTVGRDHDLDEDNAYTVSKGYCGKENNGDECEPDCGADVVHTGGMGCQEDTLKGDDAVWISTMSPVVAEPLAALFDSAAEFLDGAVGTPPSGYPLTRVLELARAVNGEVR